MTSMWGAPMRQRWGRRARRDPRQARFLTFASLRWMIRNRAFTPWYLVRYARLLRFRLANPHVILRGMVFLGKRVELHARPGYGRLEIGRWVHIGDGNAIRCHEGSLRIGDKVVFGKDNTVNCYLDVEIGATSIIADWVYVTDFDHVTTDVHRPIKDQGIVKTPVRIGPDCWIGTKVSVLRGTRVGRGSVLGAHAVVRGEIPEFSIAVGTPARVVRSRLADYEADAERRAALADIARKTDAAVQERISRS
ncbi:acyltransferase [Pseudonocardia acidicola]|uniref:Acyltransferase n=1 Tax=Pseudonocardia acidicola TaxID=2724939 RepID=A0ABX1SJZ7_9PSEU|nr:acyltransferase [Pseudonocardia acidicola]NMI00712.1 acyltransferase [Pseudonocardia acidicola]